MIKIDILFFIILFVVSFIATALEHGYITFIFLGAYLFYILVLKSYFDERKEEKLEELKKINESQELEKVAIINPTSIIPVSF